MSNSENDSSSDEEDDDLPAKPKPSSDPAKFNPLELEPADAELEAMDRARVGRPRSALTSNRAFVRLTNRPDREKFMASRGGERDRSSAAFDTIVWLSQTMALEGPASAHAVDELAAAMFELAPNFAAPMQILRSSAQTMLRRGARYFQFRPILIESPPGIGKTTWAMKLAELSGLPCLYLDGTGMTTSGPIVSTDAIWTNSRASEVVQFLAREQVANPIIIVDELDKLKDLSRHGRDDATEVMLPLLEQKTAAAFYDNFLQAKVDLSFINWILLSNDLNRISKAVRDRCIVIKMAAPTAAEISDIAHREIARRGLPPELAAPLIRAVRSGRLTSLRKLHKALDAAAAASARPIFN